MAGSIGYGMNQLSGETRSHNLVGRGWPSKFAFMIDVRMCQNILYEWDHMCIQIFVYIYIIWCIYIHCKHSIHIHICVYMRYTHDCYPVMAGIPRSSIWPRSRLAAKHPLGRKASRQELSWSDTCPNIHTRWQNNHNDYNPYGSTVVNTQKYLKHFLRRYLDPGEMLGCLSSKQVAAGDRASSKVKQCQCE